MTLARLKPEAEKEFQQWLKDNKQLTAIAIAVMDEEDREELYWEWTIECARANVAAKEQENNW